LVLLNADLMSQAAAQALLFSNIGRGVQPADVAPLFDRLQAGRYLSLEGLASLYDGALHHSAHTAPDTVLGKARLNRFSVLTHDLVPAVVDGFVGAIEKAHEQLKREIALPECPPLIVALQKSAQGLLEELRGQWRSTHSPAEAAAAVPNPDMVLAVTGIALAANQAGEWLCTVLCPFCRSELKVGFKLVSSVWTLSSGNFRKHCHTCSALKEKFGPDVLHGLQQLKKRKSSESSSPAASPSAPRPSPPKRGRSTSGAAAAAAGGVGSEAAAAPVPAPASVASSSAVPSAAPAAGGQTDGSRAPPPAALPSWYF
jgi:hypothetical protein